MSTAAFMAGLEAINAAVPPASEPKTLLVAAKCRALLYGYFYRWKDAPYKPITVEEIVESDLFNPETGRRSKTYRLAGKIDLKAFHGERYVIFDHKSTSEDISDPNSPYWRQLVVEAQPSHYMYLEFLNGRKVDEAVWDVVRKPAISPKQVAKKEREAVGITHQYFGRRMSDDSLLELIATERETLEMYEARLAWNCTEERPQWYFQRRTVPRLDSELHEWAKELWDLGQEFVQAKYNARHPRNSGACILYGGPCAYLGICSGHDEPESDTWRRKQQVHTELPQLTGDGRDVLTHSRLRTFQTCRQKEHLQYELGIERQDEEEKESLFFGTLWHTALNAYYRFIIGEGGKHVHCNGAPASEVGNATAPVSQ